MQDAYNWWGKPWGKGHPRRLGKDWKRGRFPLTDGKSLNRITAPPERITLKTERPGGKATGEGKTLRGPPMLE